jgi:hypothetical protein
MTTRRAAVAVPHGDASNPAALAGTVTPQHGTVPATLATAGAADIDPDTAPAVFQGAWAAALTARRAHYVPAGAPQGTHHGRRTGLSLDGWDALIDQQGLDEAEHLPHCTPCTRALARMSRQVTT